MNQKEKAFLKSLSDEYKSRGVIIKSKDEVIQHKNELLRSCRAMLFSAPNQFGKYKLICDIEKSIGM